MAHFVIDLIGRGDWDSQLLYTVRRALSYFVCFLCTPTAIPGLLNVDQPHINKIRKITSFVVLGGVRDIGV